MTPLYLSSLCLLLSLLPRCHCELLNLQVCRLSHCREDMQFCTISASCAPVHWACHVMAMRCNHLDGIIPLPGLQGLDGMRTDCLTMQSADACQQAEGRHLWPLASSHQCCETSPALASARSSPTSMACLLQSTFMTKRCGAQSS